MTAPRRRVVLIAAAVAAVVLAGVLTWRLTRPAPRGRAFIVALVAVDPDAAIVVWRANYQSRPPRAWIGRLDATGRLRWVRPLPGLAHTVGTNGITIVGDVVTVRYTRALYNDGGDHSLAAFGLADGAPRWDRVLSEVEDRPMMGTYIGSRTIHGKLVEPVDHDDEVRLHVLDPDTGEGTTRPFSPIDYAPTTIGSRLITHFVGQTRIWDVAQADGVAELSSRGIGCVVGDEYMTVVQSDGASELIALAAGDPARRRTILRPFVPNDEPDGGSLDLEQCGRYDDRLVFLVRVDAQGDDGRYRTLIVITDLAGAPLHRIALPYDHHWEGPAGGWRQFPHTAPLSGDLPRFVPYVQQEVKQGGVSRLLMIDLETGSLAWTSPQDPDLLHRSLFRAGDRWLMFDSLRSGTLISFDGNTGALDAAVRVVGHAGLVSLDPLHTAGDTVWFAGDEARTFASPSIAVLDVRTLVPRFTRSIAITDVTAEVRASLGLAK